MSTHAPYSYIPLTKVDKQDKQEEGISMNSPILFDLLSRLSKEEHYEILDMLPASQGVISSFSNIHCKLYLPGCMNQLRDMTTERYDTVNKLQRAFTKSLKLHKKCIASLNVIFLWDLPNYLDKNILEGLIEYLSYHMHENVKLHFYIHTKQQMPASPRVYTISPESKVHIEHKSEPMINSPRYFQETLQKIMSPFKVTRSMLLSCGIQEYILER